MGYQRKGRKERRASVLYHRGIKGKEQEQTRRGYRGLLLENREQEAILIVKKDHIVLIVLIALRSFYMHSASQLFI